MILRKRRSAATLPLEPNGDDAVLPPIATLRDPGPGPEELAVRRDGMRRLRKRIVRLPTLLCEPLQLHALDEHSIEETARLCGISVSATKSRLFRARASLGSSLQPGLTGTRREIGRQTLAS
jgi:DNA-directed RNA polymerase specialized sigma24 family protein